MFREQDRPSSLLVETSARLPEISADKRIPETGAVPSLTVAIAASDPAAGSTLRPMVQQTGLVKEIREWASSKAVELRSAQDVPDVVFLDLNGNGNLEFVFAQQLTKLRPSAHIVACSAKGSNPDFLLQAMRSGIRDFLQ